jgi:GMP synthase (glutamine-hydrolysing)
MKVLVVQNDPPETLGLYEEYLRDNTDLTLIQAYRMKDTDNFPSVNDYTHFIIGPTPISANDVLNHDFLKKEWDYLQEIIESKKPCLGVCCGGQLLAKKLGGEVLKSPNKEIGGYRVNLTEDGRSDPLFNGFPENFPVFHWHSDMFTVPPDGKLLATGEPCPIQAFNKFNIWGVIFHLEITAKDASRWVDAYPIEPKAIGKTREQVLNECREYEEEMKVLAEKLMRNFLKRSNK